VISVSAGKVGESAGSSTWCVGGSRVRAGDSREVSPWKLGGEGNMEWSRLTVEKGKTSS